MTLLEAIILGIIQGLTEFLPISSSAHLVLTPFFLGWQHPEEEVFIFGVLVQMGTLLAVIIYFWKDLLAIFTAFIRGVTSGKPFGSHEARLGWYLILATIPAGLLGLLAKDQVEAAFNDPSAAGWFLYLTALLLLVSERVGNKNRSLGEIKWQDTLWFGVAQAMSIFPGVSRSGSSMAGGMARHFDRPAAARFSFLMSIPIMIAAGVLATLDLVRSPELGHMIPQVAAGFITAGVVGYFSIRWLLSYLMRNTFTAFAIYCIILGTVALIVYYV
jgi:undecaprenyl-diphosphatase